jgi:hypothetical protein
MGVILEIRNGPTAGQTIGLKTGESITIGRAPGRAQFAIPQDTFMSGLHFAVECSPQGCRVQDRKSSNGTFLNGARIQDAMLANGDEIKSGQTVFAVKIVADAKVSSFAPQPVPAPPAVPPSAQPPESPKPAAPKAAPPSAVPASPREHIAEPAPPPIMRTADQSKEVAGLRQPHAVPLEAPPEPPLERPLEPAARSVSPQVEEPPAFRSVPTPPRAAPPSAAPPPPRISEPPAPAPLSPAQKPAERPALRGPSGARNFAFSVMGWSFPPAPANWQVQEGFGLQHAGSDRFPSSVAATEEQLGGITLQQFVESQISTLRRYLHDPVIEPAMPPRVGGADESMAVDVRHTTKDGTQLVYRHIYARSGSSVGLLTLTTLASELPQIVDSLQPLLDGAFFHSSVPA